MNNMRVSRCYDSIIIVAVAEVDSVSPSLLARHACGDSSRRPVAPTLQRTTDMFS